MVQPGMGLTEGRVSTKTGRIKYDPHIIYQQIPPSLLDPSLISLKLSSWLTTRVFLWVFIFKIKFSYFYNPYFTLKIFFVSFTYDSRFKVVHCIDIILIYRNFLRLSSCTFTCLSNEWSVVGSTMMCKLQDIPITS